MPADAQMEKDSATGVLDVRFALHIGPTGRLGEQDAALAEHDAVLSLEDLGGEIVIPLGDGQPPLVIADDIVGLAWSLGLRAIEPLREGRPYRAEFVEEPDGLLLQPHGSRTRLLMDDELRGEVPSAALAAGLLACMRRLAATLALLGRGNADVQAVADAINDRIAELGDGRDAIPSDVG